MASNYSEITAVTICPLMNKIGPMLMEEILLSFKKGDVNEI